MIASEDIIRYEVVNTSDIYTSNMSNVLEVYRLYDNVANTSSIFNETSYNDTSNINKFSLRVMDIDKFIKANDVKEVSNPTFFNASGIPTIDGLLSNEIFGITKTDRAGIFGYIDLVEWFIDPSCYKALLRLDTKFNGIIAGTHKYSISKEGDLVPDEENGGTGIRWLKANFSKINLKSTDSNKRDLRLKYIELNYKKGTMFINKFLVIPPYYRDVNSGDKFTGVGEINKYYSSLIVGANALRENNDYGLSMANTTIFRMQSTLKTIYDWFCGNNNTAITEKGKGMSGKFGLLRRANMSKTTDYASRLVLSAPELKVESAKDLMVDLDRSALPLPACIADFYPFILFHLRNFFAKEFSNVYTYSVYIKSKKEVVELPLIEDPLQFYSDDYLQKQIKAFMYDYENRFVPVEVPIDKDSKEYKEAGLKKDAKIYMGLKGARISTEDHINDSVGTMLNRRITWCDILYMVAKKACDGKIMSFTRFPYDNFYNTIYTGIEVSSTKETEKIVYNGEYYPFYPKIRDEDIGTNTGNKFVDTMQICNLYLKGMGADYDGDQGTAKGSFFKETNDELVKFMNSKVNFVNLGCTNIRQSSNEAVQALYNMTKILYEDKDKLSVPVF